MFIVNQNIFIHLISTDSFIRADVHFTQLEQDKDY